jgi:hypothetical protein
MANDACVARRLLQLPDLMTVRMRDGYALWSRRMFELAYEPQLGVLSEHAAICAMQIRHMQRTVRYGSRHVVD